MNTNKIKYLSAENYPRNIKMSANQHTEAAFNSLAVRGINGSYPGSGEDSEVLAVSSGVSKRNCTVKFLEVCANTFHIYTHV